METPIIISEEITEVTVDEEITTVTLEEITTVVETFAEQGPAGAKGEQGEKGEKGEKGETGEAPLTWDYFASNWSIKPTLTATLTNGKVYSYTLDGITRYRFVPSTYDPTQDTFYATFNSGILSDPIVSRG